MGTSVLWPYDLADERHIYIDDWERSVNRNLWVPLNEPIKDWDQNSQFFIRTTVEIDGERLRESASLPSTSKLTLVVIVDCSTTRQRMVETFEIGAKIDQPIIIEIPPGKMFGAVQIEAHVIAQSVTEELYAARRILDTPQKWSFHLNENSARFPTEAFSFRSSKIASILEWKVIVLLDQGDLWNSTLSRSVELWVNTDLEESSRALLDPSDQLHNHYLSLVERDIVWTLLSQISYEEHLELEEPEPALGSVGASMSMFIENKMKISVSDYFAKVRGDPLSALEDIKIALPIQSSRRTGK
ncbi:hypothetical protein [Glutamicibacter ardleyensis]|uniref:hypothetical protein n=1 Tax=Glutamicibacter ardleyensis TaxID=225894 RepID=UPI003FD58B38